MIAQDSIKVDSLESILIVDDDFLIRNSIAETLRDEGYQVYEADNAEEAELMIEGNDYSMLISDLKMRRMNGLQLIEHAKIICPEIKTILLTAYGTIDTTADAMRLDVNDYIQKPVSIEELIKRVKDCFGSESANESKPLSFDDAIFSVTMENASNIILSSLMDMNLKSAAEILSASGGAIFISIDNCMRTAAVTGILSDEMLGRDISIIEGSIADVYISGRPLISADTSRDILQFRNNGNNPEPNPQMLIPLKDDNKKYGILLLIRTGRNNSFYQKDIRTALTFANNIVYSIKYSNAFEALKNAYDQLKSTHDQLIQSEKMSDLGKVISSIAHAINIPMTVILGNSQILLSELAEDNPFRPDIEEIEKNASDCSKTIKELLAFSRQETYNFSNENIEEILDKTLNICKRQFNTLQIDFTKDIQPNIYTVNVSQLHIEQVFMNLIVNALQAMSPGGKLKIRVFSKTIETAIPNFSPGQKAVVIEFEDNGAGISKDELKHIFEPFHTTKEKGAGTGLGLSISNEVVSMNKGFITCKSDGPGKGSIFTIFLPTTE